MDEVSKELQTIEVPKEIVNIEQYKMVAGNLKKLVSIKNKIQEYFNPIKRKAYQSWKEIVAKEKEALLPVEQIDDDFRNAILKFEKKVKELPKIDGISFRLKYKGEIKDKRAFLEHCLQDDNLLAFIKVDERKLNQFVNATKGQIKVPGLKIKKEKTLTVKEVKDDE